MYYDIDYENLILERQEEIEILEDDCNGDCDYCINGAYYYRNHFDDGYPYCTLGECYVL